MIDPLVPAEADLTGMRFMPLDAARLLDSDLFALSTGDEFKAAVALWCKSWGQTPPASLTNDERVLARAAGVSLADWRGMKEMALRGWVACSDGRLYHPVVAEKALEAWIERISYRRRSALGNANRNRVEFDPRPFDEAKERAVALLDRVRDSAPDAFDEGSVPCAGVPPPTRPHIAALKEPLRIVFGSEGTVEGTGEDKRTDDSARVPPRSLWDRSRLAALETDLRLAAGPCLGADPTLCVLSDIVALLEPTTGEPCDLVMDVLPSIAIAGAKAKPGSVRRWAYFRDPILEARDRRLTGSRPVQRPLKVADAGFC